MDNSEVLTLRVEGTKNAPWKCVYLEIIRGKVWFIDRRVEPEKDGLYFYGFNTINERGSYDEGIRSVTYPVKYKTYEEAIEAMKSLATHEYALDDYDDYGHDDDEDDYYGM